MTLNSGKRDCSTCAFGDLPMGQEPCKECITTSSAGIFTKWEPVDSAHANSGALSRLRKMYAGRVDGTDMVHTLFQDSERCLPSPSGMVRLTNGSDVDIRAGDAVHLDVQAGTVAPIKDGKAYRPPKEAVACTTCKHNNVQDIHKVTKPCNTCVIGHPNSLLYLVEWEEQEDGSMEEMDRAHIPTGQACIHPEQGHNDGECACGGGGKCRGKHSDQQQTEAHRDDGDHVDGAVRPVHPIRGGTVWDKGLVPLLVKLMEEDVYVDHPGGIYATCIFCDARPHEGHNVRCLWGRLKAMLEK